MRIAGRLHAAVSIRPGRGLLAVGANPSTLLSRDQILLDAARPVLAYIARAGIGDDKEGPLFRPMNPDGAGLVRRHLDRKTPWRLVKKYCRAAGIDPDRLGGRGIGIHSLRKTAINDAIRNGALLHSTFPCLYRLSGV